MTDIVGWGFVVAYLFGAVVTTWWSEKRLKLNGTINRMESVFAIITGITWIISLPILYILNKKRL